jgi:hypothetical protein
MVEHPSVAVTLVRFRLTLVRFRQHFDAERENDEAVVDAFKSKKVSMLKDGSVHFEERQGYTKEVLETINMLSKVNVLVVGRMTPTTPLVENPDELGRVGS